MKRKFYICVKCFSDTFIESKSTVFCANCGTKELVILDFEDLSDRINAAIMEPDIVPNILLAALASAGVGKVIGPVDRAVLYNLVINAFEEACRLHGIDENVIDRAIKDSIRMAVKIAGGKGNWSFLLRHLI